VRSSAFDTRLAACERPRVRQYDETTGEQRGENHCLGQTMRPRGRGCLGGRCGEMTVTQERHTDHTVILFEIECEGHSSY